MRVLKGFEFAFVAGGVEGSGSGGSIDDPVDANSGTSITGGGGGSGTGDFTRMDGASYRSEPGEYCGNATFKAPESLFGVNQSDACQKHDVCYANAVDSRATCDSQFLTNLQNACGWNVLCQIGAVVYYGAVRIGGGSSYATSLR
ncbi:MAG: hypothetical protein WCH44_19140 [Betaproteobacteria bacterium]